MGLPVSEDSFREIGRVAVVPDIAPLCEVVESDDGEDEC